MTVRTNRAIFRQVIPVDDQWHSFILTGPIVHVGTREESCVEIWFMNDPATEGEPRRFRVFGTGQPIEPVTARHLASVITPSSRFVWHVLEHQPVAIEEEKA